MIRWGVVGPGAIAVGFADAMQLVDGGDIIAVASRSADRAEAFGDRFGIRTRYGDYAALAADPDVDVVYVATPQSRHAEDTIALLEAGKHVLCEKPFALNARLAQQMVDTARSQGLFLMEAIWSRFLPAYRSLVEVIAAGRIGEPLMVESDFGFRRPMDPENRLFRLDLGGGGLLDLGIYPLQLSTLLLGPVEHVAAEGVIGETGVDEVVAAVLRHSAGKLGVMKASFRVEHDVHGTGHGHRRRHRHPGAHALPQLHHRDVAGRRRGDRRLLRGQRPSLRNRGSAPLPGRREDGEQRDLVGRDGGARHHARLHPVPDRSRLPGRMNAASQVRRR